MVQENDGFATTYKNRLLTLFGKDIEEASAYDKYAALASLVRDLIGQRWLETTRRYDVRGDKQAYYFSAEFLPGRLLDCSLRSLGVRDSWAAALQEMGIDYAELADQEHDAGLGNGGLGRLAACFLDSLAAAGLPGHGCGIRYTYGLFEQSIVGGEQVEHPDRWLKDLNVWEYRKADKAVNVVFAEPLGIVKAVPYDIPVIGFGNDTVNTMRLWSAEVRDDLPVNYSNLGPNDYRRLMEYKSMVEAISQILYPDDRYEEGRMLRLVQEYFMVSAGVQSIVRHVKRKHGTIIDIDKRVAIHINDTHPALAIPELMRVLVDQEGVAWDEAWRITCGTMSYTNHTVMPEALEKWPIDKFRSLLPRIYEIVSEINERFCRDLWQRYPGNWDRIAAMAVTAYGQVRMAHLAVVGSHSVNGVSKLHSEILENNLLKLFYEDTPNKFNNKTNGITHRRWLLSANPELAELVNQTIGPDWVRRPDELTKLLPYATDAGFQEQLAIVRRKRKEAFAKLVGGKYGVILDVDSIFDVQVKRIHLYKRQLLNVLRILELYNRLRDNPTLNIRPRTFIFAGKAAPGYYLAKRIIKLINTLATVINGDDTIGDRLKIVFIENYNVSAAELIIPASDISEQISTAGTEASGTSNMKFMLNGAITVGTLDGANVEIQEAIGADNIFIFGLDAEAVAARLKEGRQPLDIYNGDARLQRCVSQFIDGTLSPMREDFRPLYDHLIYGGGEFFELEDFAAFIDVQDRVSELFADGQKRWQIATANIAAAGAFSSDRTVREYAQQIWHLKSPRR